MNFKHFAPAKNAPAAVYTDTFLYIRVYMYMWYIFAHIHSRFIAHARRDRERVQNLQLFLFFGKWCKNFENFIIKFNEKYFTFNCGIEPEEKLCQ